MLQDSSSVIKKMLNIKEASPVKDNSGEKEPTAVDPGKSYGRQVSIQELFDGAKKQQDKPAGAEQQQQPQQQANQQQQFQKQQQQYQVKGQVSNPQFRGQGHHQGQQQNYQQQPQQYNKGGTAGQNSRPNLMMPPSRGGNR